MYPPSTFNFPLTLILSNEINAYVTAPAGLVTYQDLGILIDALGTRQPTLPLQKAPRVILKGRSNARHAAITARPCVVGL